MQVASTFFCIIKNVMGHLCVDVYRLVSHTDMCVFICLETRLVWGESECWFSICNAGGIELYSYH